LNYETTQQPEKYYNKFTKKA
jgi:hypothetical protein